MVRNKGREVIAMLEDCLHSVWDLYPEGNGRFRYRRLRSRKFKIPKSPDYGILRIKRENLRNEGKMNNRSSDIFQESFK